MLVMNYTTLASLTAREAIAKGIPFEQWLEASTRSARRAVAEAQRLLDYETVSLRQEWERAEIPERE